MTLFKGYGRGGPADGRPEGARPAPAPEIAHSIKVREVRRWRDARAQHMEVEATAPGVSFRATMTHSRAFGVYTAINGKTPSIYGLSRNQIARLVEIEIGQRFPDTWGKP